MATKKAVKKAAKKESKSNGMRAIGGKPFDVSRYNKGKTASGSTSFNNGDVVAEKLAGKTLDEVYTIGAKTLKATEKELRKRFEHLNAGMQRMNIGNMMRKVLLPKK